MAKENWKTMLADANRMLKDYGAQLHTEKEDNCYSLSIEWSDGETELYARGYFANEMEQLILDAKQHAYENSSERGDKIYICVIHAELPGRHGKVTHWTHTFGNLKAAMRWLNTYIPTFVDTTSWIKQEGDTQVINEQLAKQYDDPNNERFYVRLEDVTEQTEVAIQELFPMHQWSYKDLNYIAETLGIDYEKCFL